MILLYGGYQAIDGDITIGVLVAFVGYLQSFFDPIQQLSNLYVDLPAGHGGDRQDLRPARHRAGHAGRARRARAGRDPRRHRVRRRVVLLRRGAGGRGQASQAWALRDVSLEIRAGETLALVGETGAGKSTLAKLVARFYDPQRGAVRVDGHDLREVTQASLRRQLGIVPQEGFLFAGTVRENILVRPAGGERARAGRRRPARSARTSSSRRCRTATTPRSASAAAPVRRPAAAGRAGAGADRRPADPGARRGDRERRRARRGGDRGGPADAARRAAPRS